MNTVLIYDGSFTGFLSAVHKVFDANLKNASIVKPKHYIPDIFTETIVIETSEKNAMRVWKSLEVKITKHGANELYKAFLSEIKGTEDFLLRYIIHAYASETFSFSDLSNVNVLRISQVARMVTRELHHMQNYVEFTSEENEIPVAYINSRFDMLPLLGKYFQKKYKESSWIIYDKRRGKGLCFDGVEMKQTKFSPERQASLLSKSNGNHPLLYVSMKDISAKQMAH